MVRSITSANRGSPVASSRRHASITSRWRHRSRRRRGPAAARRGRRTPRPWAPQTAREVGPRRAHLLPAAATHPAGTRSPRLDRHVDGPAVEVHLAHRVAGGIGRSRTGRWSCQYAVPNRSAPSRPWPRRSTRARASARYSRLPGDAVELHERHLDLGVAVDAVPPTFPSSVDAAERPSASPAGVRRRGATPRDRGLDEVARE